MHFVPTQINYLLLIDHLKIISTYSSLSLHEHNPLFARKSIVKDLSLSNCGPFYRRRESRQQWPFELLGRFHSSEVHWVNASITLISPSSFTEYEISFSCNITAPDMPHIRITTACPSIAQQRDCNSLSNGLCRLQSRPTCKEGLCTAHQG